MTIEFWTGGHANPRTAAERARRLEAEGWSGFGIVDSQCLSGDPYVALTMAAMSTTTLRLGTAVTNSGTRHPSVTATAASSVQAESDGRFVLGIGRGDSALAHLGLAPAPLGQFDHYLDRLQGYLSRAEVPFDLDTDASSGFRSADTLGMSSGPKASRLHWLREAQPKVPVDVAASGPKVITIAARRADAITFAVGIEPSRLGWAIGLARAERTKAGMDPSSLALGTYVPIAVHADRAHARRMISGTVGSYARFSVMHGTVAGPIDASHRERLEAVHGAYDMKAHFTHGSPQSQQLTDEVIDAFAIAGPPSYVRERIAELVEMGLTRLFVQGPARGVDPADAAESHRLLGAEVIPHLVS